MLKIITRVDEVEDESGQSGESNTLTENCLNLIKSKNCSNLTKSKNC